MYMDENKVLATVKLKTHLCTKCGASFHKLSRLERHLLSHSSERPFVCSVCESSYKRKDALDRHFESAHGNNMYECPYENCGKLFKTRQKLNKHMKLHNSPKEKFSCPNCKETFTKKLQLRRHIREKHITVPSEIPLKKKKELEQPFLRTYECPFCNDPEQSLEKLLCFDDGRAMKFPSKSALLGHIQRIHPNEKAEIEFI